MPNTSTVSSAKIFRGFFCFFLWVVILVPSLAEARGSSALPSFQVGDRVIAQGRLERRCSARIASLDRERGTARLAFEREDCGRDLGEYRIKFLEHLDTVKSFRGIRVGDTVSAMGHMGNECIGRVTELTRNGLAALEFEAALCGDSLGYFHRKDLTKADFASELEHEGRLFTAGQQILAPGIYEGEFCRGEIKRLTKSGFASIEFSQQTCAYSGRLYSVSNLRVSPGQKKRVTGEEIFQRVMREIASKKKTKKNTNENNHQHRFLF